MSKINVPHTYTSESVSEGHPDKVCDCISDSILDACLKDDPDSRVACETLVTTDRIVIGGEITTKSDVDFELVARQACRDIGYTSDDIGFNADTCKVEVHIHEQSPDISQGVTEGEGLFADQGAGDQGMMFGYATKETDALMPAPIYYAHRMLSRLAELRKGTDAANYSFLRPDSKSQVSVRYENGRPTRLETVVISHQHTDEMKREWLDELTRQVTEEVVPKELRHGDIRYYINPTGRFVMGGPHGDCGLTGRKIIVDTYGGVGCHGGGAFSGKDPSKVDRSAAYKARYVAKQVVAAGLAKKCEVQVSYAIGVSKPLSLNIDTFGTGTIEDTAIQKLLEDTDIFDFRPAAILKNLELKTPFANGWKYRDTAAYGHFGRLQFPWEKTDKADILKKAAENA